MSNTFKDYTKSVWANKATLAGYLAIPLGFACNEIMDNTDNFVINVTCSFGMLSSAFSAYFGLLFTGFGEDTFTNYRKTRKHIEDHGTIDERFGKMFEHTHYCNVQGFKLAAKEAGLENLAKEHIKHVKYL